MNKIVVTGGNGRLGKEIVNVFGNVMAPSHAELDLTNKNAVDSFIQAKGPDLVIHLAALTDVRKCENDHRLAWQTNVEGTTNLIAACEKYVPNTYFVYMSTPCVFSGEEGNYYEDSIPYPKNFYGLTKLLAETVIKNSSIKKHLTVRANFVARMPWPYPKAFSDRYGTYLFADQLAKAIKEVIEHKLTGLIHLVGDKKISMYDLAKIVSPNVGSMTLDDYSGPKLTVDLSLNSRMWKKYKIGD